MKQWNVKVLHLGTVNQSKGQMTIGLDLDLMLDIPFLGFLLQSEGRNILVDSGGNERFLINGKGWGGLEFHYGKPYFDKALKDASITPEEIDTVIYTHLHNDHAAFSYLFKNARIIAQKKEWASLLNPLPPMLVKRDYDLLAAPELKTMLDAGNLVLIDGDLEITDGVKVITTPGHTPGSQTVCVNTKKGVVALTGDQYHLNCMAFPQSTELIDMYGKKHKITPAPAIYGPFYPHHLVYDYQAWYDSGYKIKAIVEKYESGYVIGGHEPSVVYQGVC